MYGNLKTQLQTELDEIRAAGLYKGERVIDTPQAARVGVGRDAPVLNMCANNYLGRASHPEVIAAAHEALEVRWKSCPEQERPLWQGLAQLCVALTHAERGTAVGARRLLARAAGAAARGGEEVDFRRVLR